MITEKQKIQQRIAEYKSIIIDLYEEINLYEYWLKEAQNEIAELDDEEEDENGMLNVKIWDLDGNKIS